MHTFQSLDFQQMERRYRATFFNSISGFKSVNLIGTIDGKGQSNLAIFNSIFHLGANPPLLGMVIRPDTVERHTLDNILETNAYSINHITTSFFRQAHQTSAKYPRGVSEFEACGLTPLWYDFCEAPCVAESPVHIGLKLADRMDVHLNGTIILVGEITGIGLPENCIGSDGFVDLEKVGTITCSGLDSYHCTQQLSRLQYAKPDKMPITI